MKERHYVTYRWMTLKGLSGPRAIECKNMSDMYACAYDIKSIIGIRNVRTKSTGPLQKGTKVYTWQEYKQNKHIRDEK